MHIYRTQHACAHDQGSRFILVIQWVLHIQHTSPVHTTHQSSTYSTPVQYIQHTSPVHTSYNTPVQYIQHTSLVHTTHQSSTYNTPVQSIQHMDGWISSKIKNGVAISPENRKDVYTTNLVLSRCTNSPSNRCLH